MDVKTDKSLESALVENENLKAEVLALKKLVKELQGNLSNAGITDDIRDEVRERMKGGLSQADAIQCVRTQRAHDAELERIAKDKAVADAVQKGKDEAAIKAAEPVASAILAKHHTQITPQHAPKHATDKAVVR